MKTKRRLSMETLERRLVLDGVGLNAVIVCLNDDVGNPEGVANGLVHAHGGQLGHVYEYAVKGFSAQLPDAAVEALLKNPHVKRIEPDIPMQALAQEVPTGVDRIDGELNLVAKINGLDERVDVDIAILDSGIDVDHPDLNVVGGVNTILATSSYNDVYGHGTHVAGIAAALDNEIGVVGVAPGARLWAVKVLNDRGRGNVSDIIEGIDWVTAHADTIEVANMSLGGQGLNATYHDAIRASVAAGVVYVVAAGNSSAEIYGSDGVFGTSDDFIPAAYPEVATISAFADSDGLPGGLGEDTSWGENGQDDAWWRMSNFNNSSSANVAYYGSGTVVQPVTSPGLGIDLVMPGVDIYSTYPGGGYRTMSGTSMASPHAAGLAALYIAAHPRPDNADASWVYGVRQALINGGKAWIDPVFGISIADDYYYGGTPDGYRENLGWAGQEADSIPPLAPTDLVVNVPASNGDVLELNWADNEETDLAGYRVYRSLALAGPYSQIASSVMGSQFTDTGLTNGTTYYYVVTAVDFSANESGYSNVDSETTLDSLVPLAPSNLSASAGNAQVVLNWADNSESDLAGYRVYRSASPGGPYDPFPSAVTVSQFTDTGLTNGNTYYYVVTAVDSSHESPPSNEASATPTDVIAAMHVGDLDATSTNQAKWWTATVTVAIHNTAGMPVAGATVVGSWSGGVTGTASGVTNADGLYTFTKTKISKTAGSVTFTVTNVTGSLAYVPAENHDPDDDSDGTSIVVTKPLHIASESLSGELVGDPLTPAMVNSVTDAAILYWADAGVAPDRVDMLRGIDVEIVDLNGSLLGLAYSSWIVLDRDAAGYGWMAGAYASDSLGSGAVDLFSAVTHEFGHLLGFEHSDQQYDLMASTLLVDSRALPVAAGIVTRDITGTIMESSSLLPVTLFDVLDYELPNRASEVGGAQDIAATDIDGLLFPLSSTDCSYIDRSRIIVKAVNLRVLRDVDNDETELLDDDLLALLAASRR